MCCDSLLKVPALASMNEGLCPGILSQINPFSPELYLTRAFVTLTEMKLGHHPVMSWYYSCCYRQLAKEPHSPQEHRGSFSGPNNSTVESLRRDLELGPELMHRALRLDPA